jgi:outer membrane protein assembly factor BamB
MTNKHKGTFVIRTIKYLTLTILGLALIACNKSEDLTPVPTPLTEIVIKVDLDEKWSAKAGSGNDELYLRLTPVIVGNRIYVVDAEGNLNAFNKNTGQQSWHNDTDQSITGGLGAVGTELLLVANSRGEIIAYSQKNGSEKWRTSINSEVLTPPIGADSHVLAYAANNNLYGLANINGELDWEINNPAPALVLRGNSMPLVIDDKIAYVGLSNGKVIAVDVTSGQKIWERPVSVPRGRSELQRMVDISGQMALVDDTLYAVTYQGHVAALSTATGRELWQREMSSYSGVNANRDYVAISDAEDHVWLLSAKDGTTLWKQDTLLYRNLTVPVFWHDYIIVGDKEGYLHILSVKEGKLVGREKIGGDGIVVSPIVVDDVLYVSTSDGKLIAYTL